MWWLCISPLFSFLFISTILWNFLLVADGRLKWLGGKAWMKLVFSLRLVNSWFCPFFAFIFLSHETKLILLPCKGAIENGVGHFLSLQHPKSGNAIYTWWLHLGFTHWSNFQVSTKYTLVYYGRHVGCAMKLILLHSRKGNMLSSHQWSAPRTSLVQAILHILVSRGLCLWR